MAGFVLRSLDGKPSGFISNIQRNLRYASVLGMKWDDQLIKQSKAIGVTEATEDTMFNIYGQSQYFTGADVGQKQFIAFYDKEYPVRRDFLRRFAMNGEIEFVLETIADEVVVYDENMFFAYPDTKGLKSVLKEEKSKEIVDDLNESFKKIYYAFGFNNGHDAWHYMKKFLIDGFLAFEIIYDVNKEDKAENVLGFKELDPVSLEPEMRTDETGNDYRVWIQYRGDATRQRELLDANLIYISWARANFISRLSYAERLVRSFNMLRTLENSRIIWNTINAQYRMKVIVPIGTQSEVKARTRLAELRGMYKEDITINESSGEVTIDGQPNFSYQKAYILPKGSGDSGQVDIDSMRPQGYDLSGTDMLKYFWLRFMIETKIPVNRFNSMPQGGENSGSGEGGKWGLGTEAISREEIAFDYFKNRVRSIFKDLLLKPMWMQFVLKHPEFMKDNALKSAVGLIFNEENLFIIAKQQQTATAASDTITKLLLLKYPTVAPNGTLTESPFFDPQFLVEKYMQYTDDDLKLNEKYRKERQIQIQKLTAAYARLSAVGNSTSPGTDLGGGGGGIDLGGGGGGIDLGGGAKETPET